MRGTALPAPYPARRLALRIAALLLPATLVSCSGEYGNPFENANPMVPPSAAADIVFTSNTWAARSGGGRDLFAIEDSGANLTRLTFCNTADRRCDYVEAIPGPVRSRQAVRRLLDVDGDGRLSAADGESLRILDLSRAVEGELVPANARVSGADWSPGEEILFYSGAGQGGIEDLYQVSSNGQSNQDLTVTATLRERRPRFNSTGTALAYERIEGTGRSQVWVATSIGIRALTSGGTAGEALAGTPYVVGSDADPAFSPDGRTVAFRRLVATGNGGLGLWDIMTIRTDATAPTPTVLVTGAAFRSAPDWGPGGLVYVEVSPGAGPQLVLLSPDTGARRVLMTAGAGFEVSYPHWIE
jgi:Tol biopolymer transport system component